MRKLLFVLIGVIFVFIISAIYQYQASQIITSTVDDYYPIIRPMPHTNFAVYPTNKIVVPGSTILSNVGIKNDASDNKSHAFVINIVPATADTEICPEDNLEDCLSPIQEKSLKEYMENWSVWETDQKTIDPEDSDFWEIEFNVPTDVMLGQYRFDLIACWDEDRDGNPVVPNYIDCNEDSDNIWRDNQDYIKINSFTVTVEQGDTI